MALTKISYTFVEKLNIKVMNNTRRKLNDNLRLLTYQCLLNISETIKFSEYKEDEEVDIDTHCLQEINLELGYVFYLIEKKYGGKIEGTAFKDNLVTNSIIWSKVIHDFFNVEMLGNENLGRIKYDLINAFVEKQVNHFLFDLNEKNDINSIERSDNYINYDHGKYYGESIGHLFRNTFRSCQYLYISDEDELTFKKLENGEVFSFKFIEENINNEFSVFGARIIKLKSELYYIVLNIYPMVSEVLTISPQAYILDENNEQYTLFV